MESLVKSFVTLMMLCGVAVGQSYSNATYTQGSDLRWYPNATYTQGSDGYWYGKIGSTPPPLVTATGGNTTNDIYGYKTHTFTNDGTFTVSGGSLACDVIIVAGGGGGGRDTGGGGGGGGVLYLTNQTITGANSVTVGLGGLAATVPSNGYDSAFISLTATGGGAGSDNGVLAATSGGSGGGGSPDAGLGLVGQGNNGGTGIASSPYTSGGGGGAWEAGHAHDFSTGPDGGSGIFNFYGGGGGGGTYLGTYGYGGLGGGGDAGVYPIGDFSGKPGTTSTGGGGGGGGAGNGMGGSGGSGIVIVRYASTSAVAVATTTGLVGHWPLAGNFNDTAGTNNGTAWGVPVSTNGIHGLPDTAYSFDGIAYINCGLGSELNFTTNDFSLSVWCYSTNSVGGGELISKGSSPTVGYYFLGDVSIVRYWGYLGLWGSSFRAAWNSRASPAINHWVHYAAVRKGTDPIAIYRDGVLNVVTPANGINPVDASAVNFIIGGPTPYQGRISNVRVYNRALASNEVAEIYAAEK